MAKKVGRPSKIDRFIEVAEKVIYDDNMIYLTDEELVFLINKELDDEDQIAQVTFKKWKAKDFSEEGEVGRKFLSLIKDALIIQKISLFHKFGKKDDMWTKWAWVIERKFKEWNLKQISESFNVEVPVDKNEIDYSSMETSDLKELLRIISKK